MSEKQEATVEEVVNDATETATETAAETQTENAEKLHTQTELEKIISNRLARERERQAKELEEKTATLTQQQQELLEKQQELEAAVAERDRQLLAHKAGISAERVDEALAVAEIRAAKLEITLSEALEQVATDYQVVRAKAAGVEIKNEPKPSNPYVTPTLAARFPHLAKNKKGENK